MPHKKQKVVIVNYGLGNIQSVFNKCKRIGITPIIGNDSNTINEADKLILPGVGHFSKGMQNLSELNFIDVLNEKVIQRKTPILGICLGFQLFSKYSEEGNCNGLGWINAETKRFNLSNNEYKVPHIGWNSIVPKKESILFRDFDSQNLYYFVHSYYVKCNEVSDILSITEYGLEFASSAENKNIFGVQFHPEKSHEWGELLLKNFIDI